MDEVKEYLMNADIAFDNQQYETALHWYNKVLELTPDDIYAHSRAGAICVPLEKYEEALMHFGRALELDPENGDNAFNYGNACFFQQDYTKSFAMYVEAEKAGCSDDVLPRLYYQMALLCSMRQDVESALVYFRKCEDADKTGLIALNVDLISEKLKLYMLQQDYANAAKCANQLVAAEPANFRWYMVHFSLLMAEKRYADAEQVLENAATYAVLSEENEFVLMLQRAALCLAISETLNGEEKAASFQKAEKMLLSYEASHSLSEESTVLLRMSLAELYSKNEKAQQAVDLLEGLLEGPKADAPAAAASAAQDIAELSDDDVEEMLQQHMEQIQEQIDMGEIDADMGLYAEIDFDEDGNEIRTYDEDAFGPIEESAAVLEDVSETAAEPYQLSEENVEKIQVMLMNCYLQLDDFAAAQKMAQCLKNSENQYFNYFATYTDALAERKLTGDSAAANRKYAEAQAFFRGRMFADRKDSLAAVFRARLYVEQGQFAKAEEIAMLLSDEDRRAVSDYIEQNKK